MTKKDKPPSAATAVGQPWRTRRERVAHVVGAAILVILKRGPATWLLMGISGAQGGSAGRGRRRTSATAYHSSSRPKTARASEATRGPHDVGIGKDTPPMDEVGSVMLFRPLWRTRRVVAFWLRTFVVATLVSGIVSGVHFTLAPSGRTLSGALLYPLVMATLLTWSRLLRGTTLEITPTHIIYATRDRRTTVRWRDIERTGRRPGPGRWLLGEGLVLRTPAGEPPEWRWRLLSWRTFPLRFIPLDQFGAGWRTGQIGRDIRHYAPLVLTTTTGR
jgi:hypothetical protein